MVTKSYRRLQLLIFLCAAVSQSYRAILKNDHIIWLDQPPHITDNTEILVTFSQLPESYGKSCGTRMATSLEKLAQSKALVEIDDPVVWQREMRNDRPLHGREK